jgi:serine/threonine protein kinase
VLDFGIARGSGGRVLTGSHVGVGSPGYMAPEQVEGSKSVDARCDIWALGVVMYELLAQRPAFAGDTPHTLCLQILSAPISPLAELRPDLPAALVYVIERCLERDPERRFSNIAELAEALAPLAELRSEDEATRARRRLEAVAPFETRVVRPTPPGLQLRHASSSDVSAPHRPRPPRRPVPRRRRLLSGLVVAVTLLPAIALLPAVAHLPVPGPARAWSAQALSSAHHAWSQARSAWRAMWTERAAPQPPPR